MYTILLNKEAFFQFLNKEKAGFPNVGNPASYLSDCITSGPVQPQPLPEVLPEESR